MKTHGDSGWETFPSYLDVLVERVVEFFGDYDQKLTFFIVGQDAVLANNHEALAKLASTGHEIGNHSFHHEPWLHRYTPDQIRDELTRAEDAIEEATGVRPKSFRGPGFSVSRDVLECLEERGYEYDASTLPTFLGPLARAYYFMQAELTAEEREERKLLFGSWREGMRPNKPYEWELGGRSLLEVPVTTFPFFKVPFHLSYVLYLSGFSRGLARTYFRTALTFCKAAGVEPSILLHPLDFLGGDDVDALNFFPGMQIGGTEKRERIAEYFEDMATSFELVPLGRHAAEIKNRGRLRQLAPHFA